MAKAPKKPRKHKTLNQSAKEWEDAFASELACQLAVGQQQTADWIKQRYGVHHVKDIPASTDAKDVYEYLASKLEGLI